MPICTSTERISRVGDITGMAAAIIREHGWVQHWLGNIHVGFCMYSAVERARYCGLISLTYDTLDLSETIQALEDHIGGRMIDWNDHPDRTRQEVLDVLDHFAAK